MGTVYEAVQEAIDRRVAIKVLLPQHAQNDEVLQRFFNEARAANVIEHPSIVQVSDCGQLPDGTAYLIMEYLRGETLAERLQRQQAVGQRMRLSEALRIADQLADALAAAHEKAIVHRDLKPANVMLVTDPAVQGGERIKVLDFGIAKLLQRQGAGTATGLIMGTPRYMSPEQWRGLGGVDDKTDVYALGVVLYEMLAGRAPFMAETDLDYMIQHATQAPPALMEIAPWVPPDLAELVHRLISRNKVQRPSMRTVQLQLASQLSDLLLGMPGSAAPPESAPGSFAIKQTERQRHSSQSTLGASLGQRLPSRVPWRAGFTAVAATALILLAGARLYYRKQLRPNALTPIAGSAAVPRLSKTNGPAGTGNPSPLAQGASPGPLLVSDQGLDQELSQGLSESGATPADSPRPPRKQQVRWQVKTIPSGAEVVDEFDNVLGITPWEHTPSRGPGTQVLRLRRAGFGEHQLHLDSSRDVDQNVRLKPLPARIVSVPDRRRQPKQVAKNKVMYED